MKNSLILAFLLVASLASPSIVKAEDILPVFDYESTQSFQPDMKTNTKTTEVKPVEEKQVQKVEENKPVAVTEEDLPKPVQFQLADPKAVYIPGEKVLKPTVSVQDPKLTISSQPKPAEPVKTAETKEDQATKTVSQPKTVETKIDRSKMTLEEQTKYLQEQQLKLEEERLMLEKQLKEKELAQKKAEEDKRQAEIQKKKQELAQKKAEEKAIKNEEKRKAKEAKEKAILAKKLEEEAKAKQEAELFAKSEKQRLEEELKAKEALDKKEVKIEKEEKTVSKEEDKKAKEENVLVIEEKQVVTEKATEEEKKENIDYYLKKYTETLNGEAKHEELIGSLMEPFKQSLFYKVLKDNKYETVELETKDVTSDFKPEAVVSYNVPLGSDGEFACQLMVLEPQKDDLAKLWVSELIPGQIDTVMVQDINNDAQNDIVVISTTGGVSLLKSIRVYSYDKAKNDFKTIYAMNGIMEGIVSVKSGKILISETFPGGVNRAALYVWNGRRFERLEL